MRMVQVADVFRIVYLVDPLGRHAGCIETGARP